jgi:hypothetical protein
VDVYLTIRWLGVVVVDVVERTQDVYFDGMVSSHEMRSVREKREMLGWSFGDGCESGNGNWNAGMRRRRL